jgi:Hypothetical protein (DUF2513)
MKRDWDLLRKQLSDIEAEIDFLSEFASCPERGLNQPREEYDQLLGDFNANESIVFGHLELLVDNGYVQGIDIRRSVDGMFSYGLHNPRLTMQGHDLLDTMRSTSVWELIKSTATTKGIELTFDAIKFLGVDALKRLL